MTDRTDEPAEAAIKAALENAKRQIAQAEGNPLPTNGPFASYDAATLAEDAAEAKRHGCTVDQLRGARTHGMAVEEYLAYATSVRSPADAARVEAEAKARAEAKAEAQRQALVDQERKAL